MSNGKLLLSFVHCKYKMYNVTSNYMIKIEKNYRAEVGVLLVQFTGQCVIIINKSGTQSHAQRKLQCYLTPMEQN